MAVKGLKLNITSRSFDKSSLGGINQSKISPSSLLNNSADSLRSENDGALTSKDFETKTGKLTNVLKRVTFRIGNNEKAISINAKKITLLKNIFKAQEPFGGNEDPLKEINQTLEEIGVILALDFTRREEEAKEEAAARREEKAERKRSMKERMLEGLKGAGKKGMGAAKGVAGGIGGAVAASPVGDIFAGIKNALVLLGTAKFASGAIDWLKDEKNQEKVGNFFKFIAEHWKWVLGAVAGVAALGALGGLVSVITGLTAAIGIFANPLAWKILAAIAIGYGVWKGGKWLHKQITGGADFNEAETEARDKTKASGIKMGAQSEYVANVLGDDGKVMKINTYGENSIMGRDHKHGDPVGKDHKQSLNLRYESHQKWYAKNFGEEALAEKLAVIADYDKRREEINATKKAMGEQIKSEKDAFWKKRKSERGDASNHWGSEYRNETARLWNLREDEIRAEYGAKLSGANHANAAITPLSKDTTTESSKLDAVEDKPTITYIEGTTTRINEGDISSEQTEVQSKVETISPVNPLNTYMTETPELLGIAA